MTETEVKTELTTLRLTYPEHFRAMTSQDAKNLLKLWSEILKPEDPNQFHTALLQTIRQSKWMPKLQEIFQNYPQSAETARFTAQDWQESRQNCLAILNRQKPK